MSNATIKLNEKLAFHTLQVLALAGVRQLCICPAARNSPWIAFLASNPHDFQIFYFFEERCASFFALGRMKSTGEPVAVMTTSGTAVGELVPAAMEAHYAGLPLILLTADRPKRYRLSGAPQAAEQLGIFGVYSSKTIDLETGDQLSLQDLAPFLSQSRPIHLNVCFDEPLVDTTQQQPSLGQSFAPRPPNSVQMKVPPVFDLTRFEQDARSFIQRAQNPFVVVSMLNQAEREPVVELLLQLKIPVYCEAISGLREDQRLAQYRIGIPDRIFERSLKGNYALDGVIRIGGIPTFRFWRDLDFRFADLPVLSLSRLPFSGLGRPSFFTPGPIHESCKKLSEVWEQKKNLSEWGRFLEVDRQDLAQLSQIIEAEPQSEPALVATLSSRLSLNSNVYLGNSTPIREWDLAASRSQSFHEVWASRGLNGIDGQVSTFLGFASARQSNWALIGDLTALYDLPGPWVLNQLPELAVNLVIVNNGGGKIFSRMFSQSEFQNRHQLEFSSWAKLWGLHYQKWNEIPPSPPSIDASSQSQIIELVPSDSSSDRFWKEYTNL